MKTKQKKKSPAKKRTVKRKTVVFDDVLPIKPIYQNGDDLCRAMSAAAKKNSTASGTSAAATEGGLQGQSSTDATRTGSSQKVTPQVDTLFPFHIVVTMFFVGLIFGIVIMGCLHG